MVSKGKKNNEVRVQAGRRLKALSDALNEERFQLMKQLQNQGDVAEVHSHGDLVDQSNSFSALENTLGLAEHDYRRLASIDDALKQIEAGTYGVCGQCGGEIPEARLIAMPTAKYCLNCQAQMETRR